MKKVLFIIFLLGGISFSASSQSNVVIEREAGIAELEQLHLEAWKEVQKVEGYRIQLISTSGTNSRERISKLKEGFKKEFPDLSSYIIYSEPYFRFRVGDFFTKLEAYYYLQQLALSFPGAFIVKDQVYYTEVEDLNERWSEDE